MLLLVRSTIATIQVVCDLCNYNDRVGNTALSYKRGFMPNVAKGRVYYCETSPKMMLSAQRIAPELKYPDGTIRVPTGYVQFQDHFMRSDNAVQALNDQGHEIKELTLIKWLELSQPFKNGKFKEVSEAQVVKYNHAMSSIFNLSTPDGDAVPEHVVTETRRNLRNAPDQDTGLEPELEGAEA